MRELKVVRCCASCHCKSVDHLMWEAILYSPVPSNEEWSDCQLWCNFLMLLCPYYEAVYACVLILFTYSVNVCMKHTVTEDTDWTAWYCRTDDDAFQSNVAESETLFVTQTLTIWLSRHVVEKHWQPFKLETGAAQLTVRWMWSN